jgi:cupin 2 domain-containing protein
MNPDSASIFADIPKQLPDELCQTLLAKPNVRIERIVSKGHHSTEDFWYDQAQDEWVLVLQGQARLSFIDNDSVELNAGDYLLIPAHRQHRVDWTAPDEETVWLAIHIFDRID